MPIFGQVWLWSSLAFLLGAVLCWLLVARPARNRVGELEAQLATRARRQSAPERPEPTGRRDDEAEFARCRGTRPWRGSRTWSVRGGGTTPPPLPPERGPARAVCRPEPQPRAFAPRSRAQPRAVQCVRRRACRAARDRHRAGRPAARRRHPVPRHVRRARCPRRPRCRSMSPPPSDRGWFDDELEGDAADQAPEEQPAVPRNRHHMVEPGPTTLASSTTRTTTSIGSALRRRRDDARGRPSRTTTAAPCSPSARTHPRRADPSDRRGGQAGAGPVGGLQRHLGDDLVDDLAEDPAEPETDRRERTVESEAVAHRRRHRARRRLPAGRDHRARGLVTRVPRRGRPAVGHHRRPVARFRRARTGELHRVLFERLR